MYDPHTVEAKWQSRWEEAHLFEARPSSARKYFATYPYSYMNGLPHIGHAFTALRVDFISRYKRMRGYNVLFPFAFHCTGVPIVAAAKRVAEGDVEQIAILRSMGIGDSEVKRFSDPVYWTSYFPSRWEASMRRLGMSIDWRRKFITTPLNPNYDAFVKWQFEKLRQGNYIRKGSHPVIWCPKDRIPVGDHDRKEGEGEIPTEYTLLKFRIGERFIVAATLRPETAFGQTNLWINPSADYVEASVDGEEWIVSKTCASKLSEQQKSVKINKTFRGEELVGSNAYSFTMQREIPVLPATFADPDKGTGIVSSVPSDSPDDYVALLDLKRMAKEGKLEKNIAETVHHIEPIGTIETPGYGMMPAESVVKKYNIRSQQESDKLNAAREEVYREGYYRGTMKNVPKEYRGMQVGEAREKISEWLKREKWADTMYEPSGEVICRCMTRCIVKIVTDQWFLAYGDPEWKTLAHSAVEGMQFYPPFLRKQFDNVIDWLKDWACVHNTGLGTSLPWDNQWKIESLSDSTIYMAYYTIAHYLQQRKSDPVSPDFFEYVFLGNGDAAAVARDNRIEENELKSLREEFLYWYPLDLRISGKDLVGNHLTFAIFNHTAIFPRQHWPRAYAVNGWVTVAGSKMSKSRGNTLNLDDALDSYGADVVRITEAYGDAGFDDPSWDVDFAENGRSRLEQMLEIARKVEGMKEGEEEIDRWLKSVTNASYRSYIESMEQLSFKEAIKHALLDMQNAFRWYARRTGGEMHRGAVRHFIMMQALMMAPFSPHICEEIWEMLGNEPFISKARMPEPSELEYDEKSLISEDYLREIIEDITEVQKVAGDGVIYLYTAADWKRELLEAELSSNNEMKENIRKKVSARAIEQFYKKLAMERKQGKLQLRASISRTMNELEFLSKNSSFLSSVLNRKVYVASENDQGPGADKKGTSFPGRPAIYLQKEGAEN
jgi:leucyl-tRNA synthetase